MNKRRGLIVVLAVALLAGIVACATVRDVRLREFAPFTELTRAYLDRALAGDSAGVATLSAEPAAAMYALGLAEARPADLRLALRTLRPSSAAWASADTAVVNYASETNWCAGVAGATDLQVQFVRTNTTTWKVLFAGPGIC